MLIDYSETPTCPQCHTRLLQSFSTPSPFFAYPPSKHKCARCEITICSWVVLVVEYPRQFILPLNFTDYGNKPEELWRTNAFDFRKLLVFTSTELKKETNNLTDVSADDVFGLYEAAKERIKSAERALTLN